MAPPAGYSKSRIRKPCAACGAMIRARHQERMYQRAFTCQTQTADIGEKLPDNCWLKIKSDSPDVRVALVAMSETSKRWGKGQRASAEKRAEVVLAYIREVGSGEPSIQWYRDKLKVYSANVINGALATFPYWNNDDLRLRSLQSVAPIDKCVDRVRTNANDHLADLLAGYVDHHYDLMAFGFENGLYGSANPVKLTTLHQRTYKLANYLEWIFREGHETLQHAGRSVLDEYITEKSLHPSASYQISRFYDWVRKTHRFVPAIAFNRRGRGKHRDEFPVLKLKESQETYARICKHPEPQGRALALLALLYAQRTEDSLQLKREDLHRDETTGLWVIARLDQEPIAVEPEVSAALDECLVLADAHTRKLGLKETEYVFPGRTRGHFGNSVACQRIVNAAGVSGNLLRRTAVVNMYRGGQKTMGTVVLRDVLGVSAPTIHQAIKMTGESVNAPTAIEEADELRRAFLEEDDE